MSDETVRLTSEQLDGMSMWDRDVMLADRHRAAGAYLVKMAVDEIRSRRTADLTGCDLSELSNARACIKSVLPHHCDGMVDVIDRILRAHGVP